jgi:3-oxoacyl-[acyl-carrier protein] reductase
MTPKSHTAIRVRREFTSPARNSYNGETDRDVNIQGCCSMTATFFRLNGGVALVTGGGQGIGAAICTRLAEAGARVAIFDCLAEPAATLATAIGGIALVGDVTSEADIVLAIRDVETRLGSITILVNNAGVTGKAGKTWELSREDLESVMRVNLTGPFLCCRAVIPGMLHCRYGRIVNIASIAGKEGNPTLGPYSASKAALICFTKSLAKELTGAGDITVNAVSPAVIATPILEGLPEATVNYMVSRIPMGRTGRPEEVAALVHYLASSEASFTTGQCYDISGGRATY